MLPLFRPLLLAALLLATPASAADKLTLLLDWYVNPDHAALVVAKEGGYFERAGLDVEMIAPSDPSAPPRLVAAGRADIAVTYQPDLLMNVKEGLPLMRFATLVETPLNCLIVLKDGPIKSLADLKGKKIGFSVASVQSVYIDDILKSVGLSAKDVELVNVNFNLTTALMSKQVDAAIDGYRNVELIQLALQGYPAIAYYPEEHGVPPYDELILIADKKMRDDPRLVAFNDALERATLFLTNHPDEAWAMFVKAYPDLDDALNKASWAATLPRLAKRPGALDTHRYTRFAEYLKGKGLIDTAPPLADYAIQP